MLLLPFSTGIIASFGYDLTLKENIKNETKIINPFGDAIPRAFFGDYSNSEFWSSKTTNEIVYHDPQSSDFIHYDKYDGIGIWFFNSKTMIFNNALNQGYEKAKYQDEYKSFVTTPTNKKGFFGIDFSWNILQVSHYLEDWIVWNCNEFLNYDDIVGRLITNEDINLKWGEHSLVTDKNLLERTNIGDYQTLGDYISIGSDEIYPISKTIFPNNKTIFPNNKTIIGESVSTLHFHLDFRKKLRLQNNLNDFKLWSENYLYQTINRDFITLYGADQIEHDYKEGYFPLESINHQNSSINFYDANDNPLDLDKENKLLSEYQVIKVKILVNNTFTSTAQEYNNVFFPKNELTLSFASSLNCWQILLICLTSLVVLFFLINFIILIYNVWKQKHPKTEIE